MQRAFSHSMFMKKVLLLTVVLSSFAGICNAASMPFGVASAYNLVALGTVDTNGNTVIAGNISTNSDVTGRVAAANMITTGTTIGSHLNADPFGSAATFDLVAPEQRPHHCMVVWRTLRELGVAFRS